jgi:hypothetical protein
MKNLTRYEQLVELAGQDIVDFALSVYGDNDETADNIVYYASGMTYDQWLSELEY